MKPVQITTPRLVLREFDHGDFQSVYDFASDMEVLEHSPWGPHTSIEDSKKWIVEMLEFCEATPRVNYELAITLEKKVIGTCRLGIRNTQTREAYIGYTLRKNVWGNGYATEISKALLKYAFENLKLHRVTAQSSPHNLASHRVLEKVGMAREGHLRKNVLLHGKWRDSYIFAILEEDWSKAK